MWESGPPARSNAPPGCLAAVLAWAALAGLLLILLALLARLVQYEAMSRARTHSRIELLATLEALTTAEAVGTGTVPTSSPALAMPAACGACHVIASTAATGNAGPDLTHIGTVAADRIRSPDYAGQAHSAVEYIRESILRPDAYIVPGAGYSIAPGVSSMPAAIGESLRPDELDRLVESLARLR